MFQYQRAIHVYETDLMGIVHHSNYLRICEEARVAWCISKKIIDTSNRTVFGLTVVETRVRHLAPARYGDQVIVSVQAKSHLARLFFQYRMQVNGRDVAMVETIHCRLDEDFKVLRLEKSLINLLKEEIWTETWL
ncbi:MAG: thioesterase family protein [Pseudobdellovibrio sp.]